MNVRDLVNKEKLRCDDIITICLILFFGFSFIFFRLIVFMSLIIYPLSSVFIYGIFNVYKGLFKKNLTLPVKILKFILGIGYFIFSSYFLITIFSYPNVPINYIISLLSIPLFFIGFAAILKGAIVRVYSPFYRRLNITIGFITLFITVLTSIFAETYFIPSLISLVVLLVLNGIIRSGLYLSEYGLTVWNLKNLRLVFYIMDSLQMINPEDAEIQN